MHRRSVLISSLIVPLLILSHGTACAGAEGGRVLAVVLDVAITGATAEMISDALEIAQRMDVSLVVVRANTPGGEVNAVKRIMDMFEASPIPVCLFVHPPGASAWSGGTYLMMASHVAAMASGTSIGSAQPILSTGELINETKTVNALTALMVNHAVFHGRNRTAAREFVASNLNLGPEEALRYGVIELIADDIPTLLLRLSELTLVMVQSEGGSSTWRLVTEAEAGGLTATKLFSFSDLAGAEVVKYQPGIQAGLLQILFDPLVSSIMFTLGFFMVFIGIQTPGLGMEFVGGLFLLLSLMAFQVIGVESTVLLLFAAGFTLILAELQTGIGFLGLAGAICIILGSFVLFPSPHWLLAPEVSRRIQYTLVATSTVLCVFFGFLVYKVAQAKRLRAWTDPGLVEESKGVATTDLSPYGEVRVLGERWRARVEDGPVERGREVLVIGREGLLLLVRPSGEGPSMAEPQPERGGYT